MPWNGAGVFQRIYNWANDYANGIYVRYDRMDTDSNDIAVGISNCIARDGQAAPTADISWGANKITNLANGVAVGDAVTYGQVFNSPTFTIPSAAETPADGDNTTKLATTEFAMNMVSPSFRGNPTAPTAPPGTNTNQIATMAALSAQAFSASLPNQAGNAGKFVTTDGTSASWASVYPSQTGNAGKFLSTNGASASWADATPFSSNTALAQVQATALCF